MGIRFEFDAENKILLGRVDGRLTDESLAEIYEISTKYAKATDASMGIWDTSSITDFAVSSHFLRALSLREPIIPDARGPRVIVAPATHVFGLFRMFQITGDTRRPQLQIVRTMDEAFAALGVQSPHFEPLE